LVNPFAGPLMCIHVKIDTLSDSEE